MGVEGCYKIDLTRNKDSRGFFQELYRSVNNSTDNPEQISWSNSQPFTWRGIHVSPYSKIVTCTRGNAWDYVVDLRKGSSTFKKWIMIELQADIPEQLYIPAGCGHGYLSGPNGADYLYLQSGSWNPKDSREFIIHFQDPIIALKFPDGTNPANFLISEKDSKAPSFASTFPCEAEPKNENFLVIGGSGQVGQALISELGDHARGTYKQHMCKGASIYFDMGAAAKDKLVARALLQQIYPSVVIIAAGMTHVDLCEEEQEKSFAINSIGPGHIAAEAHAIGAQVVYYSTDYVFDGKTGPYDENAVANPLSVYGKSKLEGERRILEACPSALIIRTTVVYGPDNQNKNVACQLLDKIRKSEVFQVASDQFTTPAYNKDVAQLTIKLLEKKATGIFNVVGDERMSRVEFVSTMASVMGIKFTKFVPMQTSALGQKAARPLLGGLKNDKMRQFLGQDCKLHSITLAMKDWNPPVMSYYAATQADNKSTKKIWYAPNQFEAYGEEEIKAVEKCLRDGWLAPGPRTALFESKVSEYFGKKCGVMVNSGSSANMIGLAVLGLPKGSEIVTTALSFSTVLAPIEQLGLKPIFVDSIHGRYVPSVDAIVAAITPNTKCLMIPNLVGSKIDWDDLRARTTAMGRSDIILFEDSCDTMTYTKASDISAISFYASHIITAGGCGGCIMFNDNKLHQKALMFRDWGRIGNNTEDVSARFGYNIDGIEYDFKFLYGVLGYNMKCCEMNAAFGLVQMEKLDHFTSIRRANINRYVENLRAANTSFTLPVDHAKYDWLAMPLMHTDRKGLLRFLEESEVQVRVTFSGNITRHPAFRHYLGVYPEADRVMTCGFLLGAHHGLSFDDIDRVCDLLIRFDKGKVDQKWLGINVGQVSVDAAKYEQDMQDL